MLLFDPRSNWSLVDNDNKAVEIARGLESFEITDAKCWRPRTWNPLAARGKLDQFVAKFENVQRLVLHPCAISELSTLSTLRKLTHLEIIARAYYPLPPLASDDLVNLFGSSSSLTSVRVSVKLAEGWPAQDKKDVKEAARAAAVDFAWV